MLIRISKGPTARALAYCLWMAMLGALPHAGRAQFMRVGPFDVDITAQIDAIYSSNIDRVRPSEADEEMSDYYLKGILSFDADADLTRHIKMAAGFSLEQEKHFRRSDLDDRKRSDPFGKVDISTDLEFGHYTLDLFYLHESTYEYKQGQFIEGPRKKRTYRRSDDAGARLNWQRGRLRWFASAEESRDRYVEDEYKDGDENQTTLDAGITWDVTKRVRAFASHNRTRKQLLNQPDSYDGWDDKTSIGLTMLLIKEPQFTYSLAMEKSKSQGEDIGWQPAHTFNLMDEFDITKTLKLTVDAAYDIKKERGPNEIGFTYGATLAHDIARTARQTFRASREPADTFGSTADTDSTKFDYSFTKQDLFIYGLSLNLGVQYSIDKPMGSDEGAEAVDRETERTWTYRGALSWQRKVSRKLDRTVTYEYQREKSNLENEAMQEHRVTLSYVYRF